MEKLLDKIESEIKKRRDYLHHLRFGNRIVFKSNNNQIHWIIIDTYVIDDGHDAADKHWIGPGEMMQAGE